MKGRRRPLSLGLLVTGALVALPAGVGVAAASLTVGGVLAGASTTHTSTGSTHASRPTSGHRGPCSGRAPVRLHLKRLHGSQARLSWSAPSAARVSSGVVYRVLRSGRTVGQTFQPSMVLAVTPGLHTTFAVQARYSNGALRCTARLSETVTVRAPGGVPGLKVVKRTATGATIGWRAARRGDAPIAGYRVRLDGAVTGQTRSLRYTMIISSARSHRVTVAAVDTRDRLGASSGALMIGALARPHAAGAAPSMPEGISAADVSGTEATIVWLPSRRGAAPLAGYRVYRDGTLVGQTSATTMRLTHLAFPQTYAITVAAVDTDGTESAHSSPLKLTTAHPAPTAPSLLSAVGVTDTSATLSWQAGTAADGVVTGYLLFKNGEPAGFVNGQIVTVALASARSYAFTVRTRDSDGYLSAPAPESDRGDLAHATAASQRGHRRGGHEQLGADQLAAERRGERQHRRLPAVPRQHPGGPEREHRTDARRARPGQRIRDHGQRRGLDGGPQRTEPAADAAHGRPATDARQRAGVPARLHERKLPGPAGPLRTDRGRVPDLLRLRSRAGRSKATTTRWSRTGPRCARSKCSRA